ncbi:MAG: hypothetical protein ACE5HP_11810 [Gemmatimonadota bacterium]
MRFGRVRITYTWLLLAVAGCRPGERVGQTALIYDSAGVRIAENPKALVEATPVWTIAEIPRLDIGAGGRPGTDLFRVTGALRLDDGRIAVVNGGSAEVRFYGSDGRLLNVVGGSGKGPREFQFPYGIFRVSEDSLLVWDPALLRLTFFTGDGAFAGAQPLAGRLQANAFALGADAAGVFFAAERFVDLGETLQHSINYWTYTFDTAVVDSIHSVSLPSLEHVQGRVMGPLFTAFPVAAIDRGGRVYVGRGDAEQLEILSREGRLIGLVRWVLGMHSVTDEDVSRWMEERLSEVPQDERATVRRALETLPRSQRFPAYSALVIDRSGDLWIRRYAPTDAAPSRWLVMGADGQALARVVLPAKLQPYDIGEDYLLGRMTDELDVEHVRLYDLLRRGSPRS